MKKYIKFIIFVPFVMICLDTCIYHRVTHLNEDELAWITNLHIGDTMSFQTEDGTIDTLVINDVQIRNSWKIINWAGFNISSREYIATAHVSYSDISNYRDYKNGAYISGNFVVKKPFRTEPIVVVAFLNHRKSVEIPLTVISMQISGNTLDDVVYIDESLMEPLREDTSLKPIKTLAWSKKYGLVQYTFQDGSVFNRIDLK